VNVNIYCEHNNTIRTQLNRCINCETVNYLTTIITGGLGENFFVKNFDDTLKIGTENSVELLYIAAAATVSLFLKSNRRKYYKNWKLKY
jgi:hypothetical protein